MAPEKIIQQKKVKPKKLKIEKVEEEKQGPQESPRSKITVTTDCKEMLEKRYEENEEEKQVQIGTKEP